MIKPVICFSVCSWKVGDWETCSTSCGGGSQYRSVVCVQAVGDLTNVVNNSMCKSSVQHKPEVVRACNQYKCPEWSISDWSAVSKPVAHTDVPQLQILAVLLNNE